MSDQHPVEPSVNLFIRTLTFPFEMSEVIGVPHVLRDRGSPPDTQCALLVHELNHLHAFMSPLGVLYTALAFRLKNLHDEAAELNNTWLDLATNGDQIDHQKCAEVVDRISSAADYAMRILTFVEYMMSLLEGLATFAEMEVTTEAQIEIPSMVAGLELLHASCLSLLRDPAKLSEFQSEVYAQHVVDEFERQLKESRGIRRLTNADRILFSETPDDSGNPATAPYFLGYLFIRRLLQGWEAKVPHQSRLHLYRAVRQFICAVLPMTLLYPYSAEEPPTETIGPCLNEESIVAAIHCSSTLGPSEIETISSGGLFAIDLRAKNLLVVSDMEDPEGVLMDWILAAIFPELKEDEANETRKLLWQCERAKSFKQTSSCQSAILGVNPPNKLAFLIDTSSGHTAWFPFTDGEYDRFLLRFESDDARLPRLKLQPANRLTRLKTDVILFGNVSAYLIFYPQGVENRKEPGELISPIQIMWKFVAPERNGGEEVFFSAAASVHDIEVCTIWQPLNQSLLEGFKKASDISFKPYRETLEGISDLYQKILTELLKLSAERVFYSATDGPKKMPGESRHPVEKDEEDETDEERLGNYCLHILSASKRCMERNNAAQYTAMQIRCRAFYVNELFPKYDQPDLLASRKFDVLNKHLPPEDLLHLRTWLLHGAAFDERGCYVADEHDAPSVATTAARISSVCSDVLGVPLVRYQPDSRSITLDLLKI